MPPGAIEGVAGPVAVDSDEGSSKNNCSGRPPDASALAALLVGRMPRHAPLLAPCETRAPAPPLWSTCSLTNP